MPCRGKKREATLSDAINIFFSGVLCLLKQRFFSKSVLLVLWFADPDGSQPMATIQPIVGGALWCKAGVKASLLSQHTTMGSKLSPTLAWTTEQKS